MRRILLFCLFAGFAFSAVAQDDRADEKNVLYTRSTQFGVLFHTRGYGVDMQFIKQKNVSTMRLIDVSAYELMHPKEILLPNPLITNSRLYAFGKINNLFALKFNYGARKVLGDRFLAQDIKVNFNYSFGPVVGWLKPVYYDIQIPGPDGTYSIVQKKFDLNDVVSQKNTVGPASLTKGLNESFFTFGGNAKTGLSFEWGKEEYKFYSLETGVMVDAFPAPVPIFASIKNDQVFVNLYLCLTYGTRK
jgi:hypothetical protein